MVKKDGIIVMRSNDEDYKRRIPPLRNYSANLSQDIYFESVDVADSAHQGEELISRDSLFRICRSVVRRSVVVQFKHHRERVKVIGI